jgi:hypothetical protein
MRKFLLASVCTLGAVGFADLVHAQTPSTGTIGQRPGDTARGMITTAPTPTVQISNPIQGQLIGKPGATPGANNNNNAFGTARTGASAVPTPGTLVIHFNSRVMVQWYQGWNSLMSATPGAARTSNQLSSYMRMYGGADGMAANGLRYGGAFEVRMNVSGASNTPNAANPASQASAVTNTQTLYVRRAFVYAGTDKLGIIRLGQGDGLISLFDQGRSTFQTYSPTSNFNGSDLSSSIGGNTAIPYAFIVGSGDEYDTQKVVYLSPNFSGFDFGLMYSPSAANGQAFCGGATSSACSNITTSTVVMDGARFRDMVAAGVRYQGNVGPVNVHTYGVFSYAGHVKFNGTPAAARAAVAAPGASTWNGQFDNLSFGSAGVALTYQGFTFGGNFIGGAVNGRMAARPSGGAGTAAWLVGAQYRIPGIPMTVGTAFASIDSQGAVAMTTLSQRREYEFSFGGSYTLAPGMVVFADYLYQNRKQSGFNFLTLAPGAANNQVQGQGFVFGTMMTW